MAKVLFSVTDAQLACLERLRAGTDTGAVEADKRTVTGLRRRNLIAQDSGTGRDMLTPQGMAVIDLCEKLAIRSAPSGRRTR